MREERVSAQATCQNRTAFSMCRRTLVTWNPNGPVPQIARSTAYEKFTIGRVTSCSTIARRSPGRAIDALTITVW